MRAPRFCRSSGIATGSWLGEIGLTPRAKKVIELAVDEARRMGHHYIGTEHLLLGLLREGEGIACGVLESLGVNLERARVAVIQTLASRGATVEDQAPSQSPSGPKNNVITCRLDDSTLNALDTLVEAGVRSTRSDAAAWLIGAGIEAHRPLIARVTATVEEIRRLRNEARAIANEPLPVPPESLTERAQNGTPEQPESEGESETESVWRQIRLAGWFIPLARTKAACYAASLASDEFAPESVPSQNPPAWVLLPATYICRGSAGRAHPAITLFPPRSSRKEARHDARTLSY